MSRDPYVAKREQMSRKGLQSRLKYSGPAYDVVRESSRLEMPNGRVVRHSCGKSERGHSPSFIAASTHLAVEALRARSRSPGRPYFCIKVSPNNIWLDRSTRCLPFTYIASDQPFQRTQFFPWATGHTEIRPSHRNEHRRSDPSPQELLISRPEPRGGAPPSCQPLLSAYAFTTHRYSHTRNALTVTRSIEQVVYTIQRYNAFTPQKN